MRPFFHTEERGRMGRIKNRDNGVRKRHDNYTFALKHYHWNDGRLCGIQDSRQQGDGLDGKRNGT